MSPRNSSSLSPVRTHEHLFVHDANSIANSPIWTLQPSDIGKLDKFAGSSRFRVMAPKIDAIAQPGHRVEEFDEGCILASVVYECDKIDQIIHNYPNAFGLYTAQQQSLFIRR